MGLTSYARYQAFRKSKNYAPHRAGFAPGIDTGHINRLNARVRLAQDFQTMTLDGYNDKTTLGYSGYLQVFLTHSALERFMEVYSIQRVSDLEDRLTPYDPETVVKEFFDLDKKGELYNALCKHIDSRGKKTKDGLTDCRDGNCTNVAYISAAIRHIFAHGQLTASAEGVSPQNVNKACLLVSDFLLRFMDAEFTKTIDTCYDRIAAKEPVGGFP
jgi:hypothetical protein